MCPSCILVLWRLSSGVCQLDANVATSYRLQCPGRYGDGDVRPSWISNHAASWPYLGILFVFPLLKNRYYGIHKFGRGNKVRHMWPRILTEVSSVYLVAALSVSSNNIVALS